MTTLPLITIRAPWTWAIFHAPNRKRFENRGWYSSHRGLLLIHCAAQATRFRKLQAWLVANGQGCPSVERHHCGHVIGVVEQVDCQRPATLLATDHTANVYIEPDSEWCHVYANAWAFREPVAFVSRQGKHIRVNVDLVHSQLASCRVPAAREFMESLADVH